MTQMSKSLSIQLKYQTSQTEKKTMEAEKYKNLCEEMKKKIKKLETGVRQSKEIQIGVSKSLKRKTELLNETTRQLDKCKQENDKKSKEAAISPRRLHQKTAAMRRKIKQQRKELQKAKEEKAKFMKEMEDFRYYKKMALEKCAEVDMLKKKSKRNLSLSRSSIDIPDDLEISQNEWEGFKVTKRLG